jgi:nitric oxide reductase subunit B
MWYARSAEFLQQPLLQNLRWLRMIGDSIFALGAVGIGWFVLGLQTGWSFADQSEESVVLAAAARKAGLKS